MMPSPAIITHRRHELERWIDNAIDLLDAMDGEPDYEEDIETDETDHSAGMLMGGSGL